MPDPSMDLSQGPDQQQEAPTLTGTVSTKPYVTAESLVIAKRRLQTLEAGLMAWDIDDEIELAARLLAARFPSLPAYADMDDSHRQFYDLAIGLRGAMNLLAPAILAANDGLAKLKTSDGTSDFEYTFTVPSLAERDRWACEIEEAVGHLERLARPPARPRRQFSMFGAAGITRAREKAPLCVNPFLPEGWYLG